MNKTKLSAMFEYWTDRDNIYWIIGLAGYNAGAIRACNYEPRYLKRGVHIDAYYTPPNIIGLCGVCLWKGKLVGEEDINLWGAAISHETLHYVLNKYIGSSVRFTFDRICPKSGQYGLDGFSPNGKKSKDISRLKEVVEEP